MPDGIINLSTKFQVFRFFVFLIAHLELLERVLFRLGTADTDVQLENAVLKFLAPVLLKITSPNETVRCKVNTNYEDISFLPKQIVQHST